MRKLMTIAVLLAAAVSVHAEEWNWGSNADLAKKNWDLLEANIMESNFEEAHQPAAWLLTNAPELHVNLYIYSSQVYESLVRTEIRRDKASRDIHKIQGLQDTALMVYDRRIEFFGDEVNVLNRKGAIAYSYLAYRPDRLGELDELYTKIVELSGQDAYTINLTNYIRVLTLEYAKQLINKEEVLNKYLQIHELVDRQKEMKRAEGASTETIDENIAVIESSFSKSVPLNCDDVHKAYDDKFNTEPDLKTAKNIFMIMSKAKCTDDLMYLQSVKYLTLNAPHAQYFQVLATLHYNNKEYDQAYAAYQSAIDLVTVPSDKADLYHSMSTIKYTQGKFGEARADALKSIENNPELITNYKLIGDMYLSSYDRCKSDDVVQSRAVFMAAYQMYAKAGDSAGMASAKEQFPSKEEIFTSAHKEGESVAVGCWIGGSVTVMKR